MDILICKPAYLQMGCMLKASCCNILKQAGFVSIINDQQDDLELNSRAIRVERIQVYNHDLRDYIIRTLDSK